MRCELSRLVIVTDITVDITTIMIMIIIMIPARGVADCGRHRLRIYRRRLRACETIPFDL